MIVKMTKYSFVLLDKELTSFLEKIQSWGMVDITRSYKAIDDTSREYIERSKRYNTALRELTRFNDKDIEPKPFISNEDLLTSVESHLQQNNILSLKKVELLKEKNNAEVWGSFDITDLKRINTLHLTPHFYSVSKKKFAPSWTNDYPLQILNEFNEKIYFVVLSRENEEYHFPLEENQFPARSSQMVEIALHENELEFAKSQSELAYLKHQIDKLEQLQKEHAAVLDLYLANGTSEKGAAGYIAVLTGFAPTTLDNQLADNLEDCEVYYLREPATQEDNPPVALKNNWFASIFEPIGNLYMLPKYGELDLTPFFAPFYMLFFGLCLGDMGYGLLLVLIGIYAFFKLPKFKQYGKLVMLLGIGSIIMPAMTGTFFGMSLYDKIAMPQWFYDLWYNPDTINIKMFWFALIFGVFQIVVARLVSAFYAFRKQGWQYGIANIGWAIFVVWASLFFAEWQGGFTILSATTSYILLGLSGVAILFFSKISTNIFKRLLGGVTAIYDVTGFLGDILSYVRLFGLGAAGGILGLVMNQIALSLSTIPYVGWLLFIIMLLIGHCLVIFLSCLGAFVHPIRLTFVEFYKNANFKGGGRKYNPIKKE